MNIKNKLYNGTSMKDLSDFMGGRVKILKYNDMEEEYDNIEDLLKPYNKVILLYSTSDNYGHFVCIFKNKNNIIHFFDSFGIFPDDQKEFIPIEYYQNNYDEIPKLTKLLYDSIFPIRFNHFKFQNKKTHTCGRWCVVRLIFDDLDEYEFKKIFNGLDNIEKDVVISYLTKEI
jgi:hypothetical protein